MQTVQWLIVGLIAIAQIIQIVRSEQALKREIAAKDAALAAKDDALKARDAQIEAIRELTSVKVREHYQATKAQLEEYIEQLQSQLSALQLQSNTQQVSGESRHEATERDVALTVNQISMRIFQWLENFQLDNQKMARLVRRAAPRSIQDSPATREALKLLGEGPKGEVEIIYQRDDPEAFEFARNLYMLLLSNRWQITPPTPIPVDDADSRPSSLVAGATNSDVTILAGQLEDCQSRTDTPYCALHAALSGFGLGVHATRRDELPRDFFRIVVGPKW